MMADLKGCLAFVALALAACFVIYAVGSTIWRLV